MKQIFHALTLSVSCHGIPEENWYLGPEIYTLEDKKIVWFDKPMDLETVHNLLADLLKHSQCEISFVCDVPWAFGDEAWFYVQPANLIVVVVFWKFPSFNHCDHSFDRFSVGRMLWPHLGWEKKKKLLINNSINNNFLTHRGKH